MTAMLRVAAVQLELRAEPDLERFATHVAAVVGQAAQAGRRAGRAPRAGQHRAAGLGSRRCGAAGRGRAGGLSADLPALRRAHRRRAARAGDDARPHRPRRQPLPAGGRRDVPEHRAARARGRPRRAAGQAPPHAAGAGDGHDPGRRGARHAGRSSHGRGPDLRRRRVPGGEPAPGPAGGRPGPLPVADLERTGCTADPLLHPRPRPREPALRRHRAARRQLRDPGRRGHPRDGDGARRGADRPDVRARRRRDRRARGHPHRGHGRRRSRPRPDRRLAGATRTAGAVERAAGPVRAARRQGHGAGRVGRPARAAGSGDQGWPA